jgi:mono/diheme cytochrome c family protein
MPPYTPKILPDADLAEIERHVRTLPIGRPASAIAQLRVFAAPAAAAAPQPDPARSAQKPADLPIGKKLYGQTCAMCHGANREGGIGPDLRGEARKRGLAATINLIVNPPVKMPKLSPNPLSRDQVRQVATYVREGR